MSLTPADRARVHAEVDASRDAQGLPPTVEDPAAVSIVIAQLRATPSRPPARNLLGEPSRETDRDQREGAA
jgi:hypothetical protein